MSKAAKPKTAAAQPEVDVADLSLSDKTVLVLGLGESGGAMVRYLNMVGATVRAVDTRADPPSLVAAASSPIEFTQQALADVEFDGIDLIAWSPGISNEIGDGAGLYQRARESDVLVLGELDLFMHALATDNRLRVENSQSTAQVIAITGTNGKTTVTELAGLLAAGAGHNVCTAGNIGPSMLNAWCDAAENGAKPDLWVLELSSFQLALAQPINPQAGAILNISQDHLDWHSNAETYCAAKRRIFGPQTVAIGLRSDDKTLAQHCRELRTFGTDEPANAGDFGIVHDNGIAWLAVATPAELPVPGKRAPANTEVLVRRLMPADALRIRGVHNHLNALAALALCEAVGVSMAKMLHALRDYEGQAHRCELVAVIDGIEFYNDSKGTNVGATVAALAGLGKPGWLIAGGIGKDQDFSPLAHAVRLNAAGVILIGRDKGQIKQALADCPVPVFESADLNEAIALAAEQVTAGQAVLFSPACSSFDMFDNYQHRGDVFKSLVNERALSGHAAVELPCSG